MKILLLIISLNYKVIHTSHFRLICIKSMQNVILVLKIIKNEKNLFKKLK